MCEVEEQGVRFGLVRLTRFDATLGSLERGETFRGLFAKFQREKNTSFSRIRRKQSGHGEGFHYLLS